MDTFTFIGIEINRRTPHFTFVAIDESAEPLAIDSGTVENVLAYLAGLQHACVAINAPLRLNTGRLKNSHPKKNTPGKIANMREIEYELERLGISTYHTPDTVSKNDPVTMHGLSLAEYLPQMGYTELFDFDYPPSDLAYFEAPANAGFWSLVNSNMLPEESLLGRVQRQLILYDLDLPIINAMEFFEELTRFKIKHGNVPLDMILPSEELNAWMTAFTAMKSHHSPEEMVCLGVPDEGYLILPAYPAGVHKPDQRSQQMLFQP